MNELIRDLYVKATVWCEENAKGAPIAWEWEDKFAELIVAECMDIVDVHVPGMVGVHAIKKIAERFGVEE